MTESIKHKKLAGVELFRCIGIFGVISVHGPLPREFWAEAISSFLAQIAVPFFLATSFFFLVQKLYLKPKMDYISPKISRLVVPYAIWSLIYASARFIQYSQTSNFKGQDNLNLNEIIFTGTASVQLYFLPMLIYGTILYLSTGKLIDGFNNFILFVISIFSIALNQYLTVSVYDISSLKILERIATFILACIPYIFLGVFLSRISIIDRINKLSKSSLIFTSTSLTFFIFLISLTVFSPEILSHLIVLKRFLLGSLSLILALFLSELISNYYLIENLGRASFGIFLSHAIVIEGFEKLFSSLYPWKGQQINLIYLLLFTSTIYSVSYFVNYLISKNKLSSRLFFGE